MVDRSHAIPDAQAEHSGQQLARFLIRPNSSLSWRGNQVVFFSICSLSFGIAGAYAALGFWVVLPFAGLEMLALGVVLYHCAARAREWEMVAVDAQTVEVYSGRRDVERYCALKRAWAQVVIDPAAVRGHPSRLLIRSHGRQVEIGACLVDSERRDLARALERAL